MKKLTLFGNGEIASIAKYYFSDDKNISFICVDDTNMKETHFEKIPIISKSEFRKLSIDEHEIFVAISYSKLNKNRETNYNFFRDLGFKMPSFIHKHSYISKNSKIGSNCLILENQTVQKDVVIDDNVFLWSGNHIGHNTKIAKHVYVSSHVVISGNCNLGERSFFGVNSTVKDFTNIANDCFIGMGSIVTKDLKAFSVVLPNKSNIYEKDSREANIIKRKYFK
jgi:sugar O-acyltransferase (sialic acid O-acetyltransferase NeuD family)